MKNTILKHIVQTKLCENGGDIAYRYSYFCVTILFTTHNTSFLDCINSFLSSKSILLFAILFKSHANHSPSISQ